jgi:hypothetical protein
MNRKKDPNIDYSQTCMTCEHFKRPAPRKWRKCENDIIPRNESWKYGCCLWWEKRKS